MAGNPKNIALEPAAQEFADATSTPPFLYQLTPEEGRKAVDSVQDSPIEKPEVQDEWIDIPGGPTGTVKLRIVKPIDAQGDLPVILYIHGAGWVFGDAHTHDRLVRDLAIGSNAAVVFPEYDRSPEVKYPVAIEQSYAAAQWVVTDGASKGLDASRIAVSGDSVGGNMAIAVALLAKQRGDVAITKMVLFYPVTNAAFDTESYDEFEVGYFLGREGMRWFWDQYTVDESERAQSTASPPPSEPRGALGPARHAHHHGRGRRAPRRGRGVRRTPARGRSAHRERAFRWDHARFRDGQLAARHRVGQARDLAGERLARRRVQLRSGGRS